MPATTERERQAERMRGKRRSDRIVTVDDCENPRRRWLLEKDDIAWLMHYFGEGSGTESPFTYEFTVQQREMAAAIREATLNGGDQSIAASRGEGKTTLFERLLLKYTLQGLVKFSVLFAATGGAAQDSLESIKIEIENNSRLAADYHEVCDPVAALENTPNRAHYQLVRGTTLESQRKKKKVRYEAAESKFSWCGQEIVFPNVPGSPSAGAIIATRGLDSAVRGVKKKGRRVDVAGIDDPDTEQTASSEEQAKKLEDRIDRAIAGLGSQKRRISRVMLTTLQNRTCVSYRFTDPIAKPSWSGRRFRFLIKPPDRVDLWDEYVQMRQADWQNSTSLAMEFYLANRDTMDAGSIVANKNRYVKGELSALQFYYNEIARIGADAVATEYDNDPPEIYGPVESGITSRRIQRQVNGYGRGIVPPDCPRITMGIDVGKKVLHFAVRAWRVDGTGFTIDKDVIDVHGTTVGSDEGLDKMLRQSIVSFIQERRDRYVTADGEVRIINRTLVDAGYRTEAIYEACLEAGLGVMPVMGFGKSRGCVQANFSPCIKPTDDRKPGDNWFLSRRLVNGRVVWLVCANTDHWKSWEHDRWMTSPGKPGGMTLYGEASDSPERLSADEKDHHSYAHHIVNEVEVEELYRGAMRRRWKNKSDNVHWLDASYYSDVAASMEGIRIHTAGTLLAQAAPRKPKKKKVGYL